VVELGGKSPTDPAHEAEIALWMYLQIPQSSEGKDWFYYVDATVTLEQLEQLTAEFLVIYEKCPSRLKKINSKRNEESFNLLMSGTHQPNSLVSTLFTPLK
jgi:hypothetical protein